MIYATASRASPRAGWIAALVYLSTPWVYRIGIIAYVEGPLCFYQMALVWAWLAGSSGTGEEGRSELDAPRPAGRRRDGMQVHGPGLGGDPLRMCWRSRTGFAIAARVRCSPSAVGWAVVMAPWLIKNVIDTGDPVYPLGYRFFHGRGLGRRHAGEVAGRARPARPSPGRNSPRRSSTSPADRTGNRPSTRRSRRSPCSDPARDGWRGCSGASPPTSSRRGSC